MTAKLLHATTLGLQQIHNIFVAHIATLHRFCAGAEIVIRAYRLNIPDSAPFGTIFALTYLRLPQITKVHDEPRCR